MQTQKSNFRAEVHKPGWPPQESQPSLSQSRLNCSTY